LKKERLLSSPLPLPPFRHLSLFHLSLPSLPIIHAPPSHGVSSGPKITAFQRRMLSAVGEPLTPCGGSCCRRRKSRIRRWIIVFFWGFFEALFRQQNNIGFSFSQFLRELNDVI
jgi:hypothetical protein